MARMIETAEIAGKKILPARAGSAFWRSVRVTSVSEVYINGPIIVT
jgi:hypothetical protein